MNSGATATSQMAHQKSELVYLYFYITKSRSILSYLLWRLRLSLGGWVWLFSCKLARDELRVITSLSIPSASNRSLCSTSSPQSRNFGDGEFRNTSLDGSPEAGSGWWAFSTISLNWDFFSLCFLFWYTSPSSCGLLSLLLLQ